MNAAGRMWLIAQIALVVFSSFGVAVLLTRRLIGYAKRRKMMDHPDDRRLHREATPRGGGLAIVIAILLVCLPLAYGYGDRMLGYFLLLLAGLAALGWIEDTRGWAVLPRLVAQCSLAALAVSLLGGFGTLEIAGVAIPVPGWGALLALLWIVALTNLYNFMDGIDGLAASQAAVAALTFGLWFAWHGDYAFALAAYAIMAASLGFLVWNWAPARIFMGDVGSIALGGAFALLTLVAERRHGVPAGAGVLLLGLFLGDGSVTLLKRLHRGEAIWKPHRSHYYQRAVAAGMTHATVTATASCLFIMLASLATLEMNRLSPRPLWTACALVVLAAAAVAVVRRERAPRGT
jgi:Fuc2NAc and GlcNAc transferase